MKKTRRGSALLYMLPVIDREKKLNVAFPYIFPIHQLNIFYHLKIFLPIISTTSTTIIIGNIWNKSHKVIQI